TRRRSPGTLTETVAAVPTVAVVPVSSRDRATFPDGRGRGAHRRPRPGSVARDRRIRRPHARLRRRPGGVPVSPGPGVRDGRALRRRTRFRVRGRRPDRRTGPLRRGRAGAADRGGGSPESLPAG